MSKIKKLTTDEALVQIFGASYKFIFDNTKLFISFYEIKYKRLQRELIDHEESEPLKIFKKRHEEWESKSEQLKVELETTFNNLMEEYTDYAKLIGLS